MNVIDYVVENYASLPKSSFDGEECVIVKEIRNDDWGYGHHSYEGIGINSIGSVLWCYSSGCSCDGSCGTDHILTDKALVVQGYNLSDLDPNEINFYDISVDFQRY